MLFRPCNAENYLVTLICLRAFSTGGIQGLPRLHEALEEPCIVRDWNGIWQASSLTFLILISSFYSFYTPNPYFVEQKADSRKVNAQGSHNQPVVGRTASRTKVSSCWWRALAPLLGNWAAETVNQIQISSVAQWSRNMSYLYLVL